MLKQTSETVTKSIVEHAGGLKTGTRRGPLALAALIAALAITAAACSSSPAASGGSTTSSTAGSTSSTAAASIALASATAGSVGTVVTGPDGHTVYELSTERNGAIQCTGSCTSTWPPLTVTAGQSTKLSAGLSGTLGTVHRPDGTTQVTYDGHPVYYYSGDSASGQANGQGVGGVWFALTPTGATSSTSGATTSTSGGYSY